MSEVKVNPQGKTALVSGANRGIGRAIAVELLEQGAAKVYAGARNTETLNDLAALYGSRLVPVQLDVTDTNSVAAAAAQVEELDILVNNAGIVAYGNLLSDQGIPSLKDNLDVNVWGLLNVSNALANHLKKDSETAIVNVSSMAGLGNMAFAATYSVSKAAVHSITQGMRTELGKSNALVMGVYPGPIDTDLTADFEIDKDSPQNVAKSVVNGLSNGTEDVFPDAMSAQMGSFYQNDPKGVEKAFAAFGEN